MTTAGLAFVAVILLLLMSFLDMGIYHERFSAALSDLIRFAHAKLTLVLLAGSLISALWADLRHKRKSDPQEGGRST